MTRSSVLSAGEEASDILIGTYLGACTIYSSVYKKSPVGNTYLAGLEPKIASFLQATAWETVLEYFGVERVAGRDTEAGR